MAVLLQNSKLPQIYTYIIMKIYFTIKLLDINIGIECMYDSTRAFCAGYETDEETDFTVSVKQADIEFERGRSIADLGYDFSDAYLETLAVYRKISEKLPFYDGFLFHSSAIAVDGQAYLFTAKSGTGKSTHTRLWRKYFGDRAVMVNDDKPFIKVADTPLVYGTPWNGKHRLGSNIYVPIKAICILTRSEDNYIYPISGAEALPMLIQQTYRAYDGAALSKTMTLLDKLIKQVRFYKLGCNMDIEAAKIAYEGMRE